MTGALDGKAVVVTGAGAGIGLGIVTAAVGAGANVLAVTLDADDRDAVEAAGGRFFAADVGGVDTPSRMIAQAVQLFGRVDGLVANAGLTIEEPFLEMTVENMDLMWRVNQRGAALSAQAAARAMVADGRGGSIVLMGSNHARSSLAGYEGYAGTKAAVAAMGRAMAWSLGPHGIRVNTLAPGLTETEALAAALHRDPALRPGFAAAHATGRWNSTAEVAAVTVFLLSDAAAALTGAELIADQGMSARLGRFEG
jgi:3-oxoacyl-[acyl-carrier protein] reductase